MVVGWSGWVGWGGVVRVVFVSGGLGAFLVDGGFT